MSLKALISWLPACVAAGAGAAEPVVNICFDERDQSAFMHRDAGGAWQGAALELVQRSFARAGLRLRLHAMPWGRCLREVAEFGRNGQIEALFYASRNAERERQFLVSDALHQLRGGAWYSRRQFAQAPRLQRMEDLGGYRLCGIQHNNYDWLRELGLPQIDQGAPSLRSVMAKLQLGRCELVLSSWEAVQGSQHLGQLEPDADRAFLPYPGREPASQHLMLARDSARAAELLQRFNAALGQLRADGSAQAIYRRHFGATPVTVP